MPDFALDLRYAVRQLRRSPGFVFAAVTTLALGIGANTAMFSDANSFLWSPPPVARPAELVSLFRYDVANNSWADLPYADLADVRAARDAFSDVTGYYPFPFAVSEGGTSQRIWGEIVAGNYFTMFGVRPQLGRAFTDAETSGGTAAVTVISDDLWRTRFHADANVVGKTIRINGTSFTIAGVAPASFHGVYYVGFRPALWIPAGMFDAVVQGPAGQLTARDGQTFRMMARLAPGATPERAQAALQTIMTRIAAEDPASHRGFEARVLRERDARPEPSIAGGFALAAKLFLVAVALVLLIACVNVANLLLARATGRRKEIAVRLALGASRGRLVRQLLVESLLLAALGGAAGIALAFWATGALAALLRMPTDLPFAFAFAIDGRVLLYTGALALLAGLAFGLTPALRAARPELVGALKNETVSARGLHRSRLRDVLVVGQIAVSCVLLVTTGLALRTLSSLRLVDPGFDAEHGLLVTVAPDLQRYDQARGEAFYRALLERAGALPGVRAAGIAQFVPMDFISDGGRLYVAGREAPQEEGREETARWTQVLPGFFAALDVPLLEGRDFAATDDSAAAGVVIVNQTLARRYWPGESALGKQLRVRAPGGRLLTVIGVARDMKYNNLAEPPTPFVYEPLLQAYRGYATLLVRSGGDPEALTPAVRSIITSLDPDMPAEVRTYADLMTGRALILPRFAATLAGAFGLLALMLAVVGLYGVIAFGVSQRSREIGIRVALGARRGTVLRLIVNAGLVQAGIGIAIGLVIAFGATRAMRGLLYGVGAADPLTYAAVAALLIAVAAAASFIPARRATRVDPMVALRNE